MNVTYKMSDRLVWIATVFLFSSITIFESYTWGKYILILACLFILFVDVLEQKDILIEKFDVYRRKKHIKQMEKDCHIL